MSTTHQSRRRGRLTLDEADRIFDMLVGDCGADVRDRDRFLRYAMEEHVVLEWRFGGMLGSGGKVYYQPGRENPLWVACYPEDETSRRRRVIDRVNGQLARMASVEKIP